MEEHNDKKDSDQHIIYQKTTFNSFKAINETNWSLIEPEWPVGWSLNDSMRLKQIPKLQTWKGTLPDWSKLVYRLDNKRVSDFKLNKGDMNKLIQNKKQKKHFQWIFNDLVPINIDIKQFNKCEATILVKLLEVLVYVLNFDIILTFDQIKYVKFIAGMIVQQLLLRVWLNDPNNIFNFNLLQRSHQIMLKKRLDISNHLTNFDIIFNAYKYICPIPVYGTLEQTEAIKLYMNSSIAAGAFIIGTYGFDEKLKKFVPLNVASIIQLKTNYISLVFNTRIMNDARLFFLINKHINSSGETFLDAKYYCNHIMIIIINKIWSKYPSLKTRSAYLLSSFELKWNNGHFIDESINIYDHNMNHCAFCQKLSEIQACYDILKIIDDLLNSRNSDLVRIIKLKHFKNQSALHFTSFDKNMYAFRNSLIEYYGQIFYDYTNKFNINYTLQNGHIKFTDVINKKKIDKNLLQYLYVPDYESSDDDT